MLKLKSFAKINIGLEVLYKRQDGYHEINTIFSRIGLADEILIEQNKELIVDCFPSLELHQQQNLAYKSGKLIQKYFACKSKGAKIQIYKNIPLGGGLGGGSSNASTVLTGLNKLWQLNASAQELHDLASQLGADVPFFLGADFAVGKGIGEKLDFFNFSLPYHLFLVMPNFNIDTSWAYSQLNRKYKIIEGSDLKNILIENINRPEKLRELIKNAFEDIVFEKYPVLSDIKNDLYKSGAVFALMSGSGSSIYGFFDDEDNLNNAKSQFNKYQTFSSLQNHINK
ncbi:MAG: 4-(cytidine 5'-diphospho)-2-C-methyl-D-erythritol kinase [bacterium]